MSKYDAIKTAADLINEVRMFGLSADQDDVNRAADIFDNSPIGELVALANDDGTRTDENGHKWGTGRRGTQGTFYFIAFSIWNWRDATRFFNEHTNSVTIEAKKNAIELNVTKVEIERLKAELEKTKKQLEESNRDWESTYKQFRRHEQRAISAEAEITALKAKLYDLLMSKAG
jgi:hypothetical protein